MNRSGNLKHLDSAIILGSKVLADKNPSKYIEDALYIIGKAQYYKNDYSGAKRKFNELLFKFPETDYGPEVGMLLARTLVASKQLDTAETVVKRAASIQADDKATQAEVHRLYAELLAAKYPDSLLLAVGELKKAQELSEGNDAGRLAFERGALLYIDGKWDLAADAFSEAIALAADDFLLGEARIGKAQALRRSGRRDEALSELEAVRTKTRFGATHPPAHFEHAVTIEEDARAAVRGRLKDPPFRRQHYQKVRMAYFDLDTTYGNVSQAIMARSRFRQAELFREMGEYDSAARIANLIIGTKDFSTPEMNDYVNERMRALVRFAENKVIVERMDKVERLIERSLRSGSTFAQTNQREIRLEAERIVLGPRYRPDTPPTFTPEEEELVKEAEVAIRKRREEEGNPLAALRLRDTSRYIDSLRFVSAKAEYELARAYETFEEPMMAVGEYQSALNKRYNVIDTPKRTFHAQVYYAWIQLDDLLKRYDERDSLITILMTGYGETVYAGQAARLYGGKRGVNSPGEIAYAAAYKQFRQSGLTAKQTMLNVVRDHSHEDVAPRALYAIGIAFEDANSFDSAVTYYRLVINGYPYSKYAEILKPRLAFNAPSQTTVKLPKNPDVERAVTSEPEEQEEQPVDIAPVPPVQIPDKIDTEQKK